MQSKTKEKILIIGAASSISSIVSASLSEKYDLVGLDIRPLRDEKLFAGQFHQVSYSKREISEIFSQHQFSSLIHLGRVTGTQKTSDQKRFRENVSGLQNILSHGLDFGIQNFIIVSTHLVYGASKDNHMYMDETQPLKAAAKFSKLASSVEFDHIATQFLWQHRQVNTTVLRPTFVVGPTARNGLMAAFRAKYCPVVLGYDPLIQVMHEQDLVQAILLTLEKKIRGVFNVAGEGVIPFSQAVKIAGAIPVAIPQTILQLTGKIIVDMPWKAPAHLVDFFRYPVVVSDKEFRTIFGYKEQNNTIDSLKSISNIIN